MKCIEMKRKRGDVKVRRVVLRSDKRGEWCAVRSDTQEPNPTSPEWAKVLSLNFVPYLI
jgi:hypothetical protein